MLLLPNKSIPIQEIGTFNGVFLWIKREDLVHAKISGNKYWKLFYNINTYLQGNPAKPMLITFGGAYSNHIAAVSALGKEIGIATFGIIRGEELEAKWFSNPTLVDAHSNGMQFRFVTREAYRDKNLLSKHLQAEFPNALVIPEGGSNSLAVEGFKHVLNNQTKGFDYICTAVGTGGTMAGLLKYAEPHQKVIGFPVVKDDSLTGKIKQLSHKRDFNLIDASFGGYGKLNKDVVDFINKIFANTKIPLDPVYTGKMLLKSMQLIEEDYFPKGSRVLAIHTGGLQGILGANEVLKQKGIPQIDFN